MAKHQVHTQDALSDKEWDSLVREFLQKMAQTATNNRGAATAVSKALGKSKSAITEMRSTGKGSVVSWVRIAMHLAGVNDAEAREMLKDPAILLKTRATDVPSQLETLFHDLRRRYDDNELAAWMKLLLAKADVEKDLGINVKASLKKDTKPKRES